MIMKLCYISKYPPIEGGTSSQSYWLARGLGEKGHEVHVVTNAYEVESEFREELKGDDLNEHYQPKNVTVHNTYPFSDPFYIPYSKPYTEKIASLAIEIIREYDLELIDSWYILPYVISGYLAKIFTGKPQIMRHAGSDMSRLFESPYLNTLFKEIFKKVDRIVTYPSGKHKFLDSGVPKKKLFLNNKVSVYTKAFNPRTKPFNLSKYAGEDLNDIPIITYMGKVGVTKGIFELTEALNKIKDQDFRLLFVCGGRGLQKLKDNVNKLSLENKTIFMNFVPPWKVPSIINASSCVVHPERDFPVLAHNPILPREVLACGKCLMISDELCQKQPYSQLQDENNSLIVNPKNIQDFTKRLELVIKNPDDVSTIGKNGLKFSKKIENFNQYILTTEKWYEELI